MPLGASAYISRPFEKSLIEDLASGSWSLLLGPRQHGKTSGLIRVVAALRSEGLASSLVDLQAYAAEGGTYADFLAWFVNQIRFEAGDPSTPSIAVDRNRGDLRAWLDAGLSSERYPNIAVVVDEASAVPATHQVRFYSQLRALFNARARAGATAIERRISFAFAGTFRPERLIDTANSPFNVCQPREVDDLTQDDAALLAQASGDPDLAEFVTDAFALVGGQPYLLQSLFAAAARKDASAGSHERFDLAVANLRSGADPHFAALFRLVDEDAGLRTVVAALLDADESVRLNPTDDDHRFAQVSGIARADGAELRFRNPLYQALAATRFSRTPTGVAEIVTEAQTRLAARPGTATLEADVLLITATGVETRTVLDAFTPGLGDRPRVVHGAVNTYFDLGVVNGATVKLVQCPTMGAGGSGGAILTAQEAIADVSPKSVVMVGVAFGVDNDRQAIGDVLVSQRVLDYELQRISSGNEDMLDVRTRGDRATASARLIGRFDAAQYGWENPVRVGLLLSGAKLVDNRDFRDDLRRLEPDACGGEMEGAGLYAAASRAGRDWVVVKAICDFADGNKRQGKAEKQQLAAERAASFVRHTLELGGF